MSTNGKTTASQVELAKVLQGLRRDIYSGLRLPRERLVEADLAETFSVNRLVIRQALNQLANEGLVLVEPYRGASVAEISLDQILESYQVVAMLEGYAAMLAVKHLEPADLRHIDANLARQENLDAGDIQNWQELNHQFHRIINYKCGNSRLVHLIHENCRFTSYWFIVLSVPGRITTNIQEHRGILESLRAARGDEARHRVEEHILGAGIYLVDYLRKNMPVGLWQGRG